VLLPSALTGAEVRGRVVVADDVPVAGVTVTATPWEPPFERAWREVTGAPAPSVVASATTAADGSFTLTIASVAPPVELSLEGAGVVPARLPGPYAGDVELGEFRTTRAVALAGRVVGPTGETVPGAEVVLEAPPGPVRAELRPAPLTARTDADGAFRFVEAAATGNRLTVRAPGFAAARLEGVRGGPLPAHVGLGPGATLSGVVVGADGRTPAAALVRFEATAPTRAVPTDAEGGFQLVDVPAGAGRLVADAGPRGQAERANVDAAAAPPGIRLVLVPAGRIEGRVVDAATMRPVTGVRVVARAGGEAAVAISGADGRYRLKGLKPGLYRLDADEPRHAPYVRGGVVVAAGAAARADLPLTLAATLSGRVVDAGGRPVVGASGRLDADRGGFPRPRSRDPRSTFRSGSDGRFELKRLAPADGARVTVRHADHQPRTLAGLRLEAGKTRTVRLVLDPGLTLQGVVIDGEDRPVAGVEIVTRPAPGGRRLRAGRIAPAFDSADSHRVPTGADGRFAVRGLAAGAYSLVARGAGFADETAGPVRLEADEPPAAVEIRLSPGTAIFGFVRHPDGSGAAGYRVFTRGPGVTGPRLDRAEAGDPTGPDGAFTLGGLREDETYTLVAVGAGGTSRLDGVRAPAQDVEIQVPGLGSVAGRVLDAATGAPVTHFEAAFDLDGPDGPSRGGPLMAALRLLRGEAGDGATAGSEDGSFLLEDVPAGTGSVRVRAPGYQPARVGDVLVREGAATEGVDVRMSRGRSLRGRVSDARTGVGVPDAVVTAESAASRPGLRAFLGPGGPEARTDADGLFEVTGLAPDTYRVTARHTEFAEANETVDVHDDAASTEIRLPRGGSVAGVVLSEAGSPVGGAEVSLGAPGVAGRLLPRGGALGGQAAATDEAGRFRFDHLSAGRYSLSATAGERGSAPVEVVLQPGEARGDLVLALGAGATLIGRVSGLPDEERSGVTVTASGPGTYLAATRTDADGSFRLGGAPAGAVDLRAMTGDFSGARSATAQVLIAEGQALVEVEIVFAPGFTVTGRVTRAGEVVGDVQVMAALDGQNRPVALARTGPDGVYRLEGLAEATYRLSAAPPRGAGRTETIALSGDATLDIEFPPARLAGTVADAETGQPIAGAVVELDAGSAAGPRGTPRAASDSDGAFTIADLEPREYVATARKEGYEFEKRTVTPSEVGDPVVFQLRRGEGLGLMARDGIFGVPLRTLWARATDAAGTPVFAGAVALDGEGRGEVPSLKPGRYALRVDSPGYAPALVDVTVPSAALAVALTPGGALEIRSGPETLADGPAVARILTAAGAPYSFSPTSPDGRIVLDAPLRRIGNLIPARYTVAVEGGEPRPVTITEGGTAVVELP